MSKVAQLSTYQRRKARGIKAMGVGVSEEKSREIKGLAGQLGMTTGELYMMLVDRYKEDLRGNQIANAN